MCKYMSKNKTLGVCSSGQNCDVSEREKVMQNNEGEGSDGALSKLPLVFDLDQKEEEIVNSPENIV